MESSVVTLVLAWLAALAFISKIVRDRKARKTPPGPFALPIIGNWFQLGTLPHITLHNWGKKYGEIIRVMYGMKTVYVALSPKWAEEFLKTQDVHFASRPPLASGKHTGYDYKDMTWAPYGPHWRMARKIYLTELFNAKRLDSFMHIRVDERRNFLAGLYNQRGKPVVLKDAIRRYTLSSISRVVLSDKYFSDFKSESPIGSLRSMHAMIDEWMILNGLLNIGDWIPFLRQLDLQGLEKRMKILKERFEKFHNYVIADHKRRMDAAGDNFVPKDMMDVLLGLTREDTDPEIKLTIEDVKALVHDLMPGGTDTSATSIEWALHELFLHPHVAKKAREEIERVIGRDRWVEEDDYPNLPYIDAIIKETLRLHPLSPLLAPHYALEDCKVGDYDVKKGTVVLINTWSIGRHPGFWEDPYEFRPERFLQGNDISMTGQDFSLLPFGSGRRRCPGYTLGLKIVRTTISNMFHGFDWTFPEGKSAKDICMVERYGLTTCPEIPLSMVPQPRLPLHLYKPNN